MVDWMVGSSTILFGVFGRLGVLIFKYKRELGRHFSTALISWCISLIPLAALGYLSMQGVDQGAHLGGFVAGILSTWMIVQPYSFAELNKPLSLKGKVFLVALLALLVLSLVKKRWFHCSPYSHSRLTLSSAPVSQTVNYLSPTFQLSPIFHSQDLHVRDNCAYVSGSTRWTMHHASRTGCQRSLRRRRAGQKKG